MKVGILARKFGYVGIVLVLTLLLWSTVAAQGRTAPETETENSTLEQRVTERRTAQPPQLDAATRGHIQTRCQASQAHLRNVSNRLLGLQVRRQRAYDALLNRLTDLSGKLQAAQLDTSQYDQQVNELKSKIETFYTSIDEFETAVNDLAAMDCAADPDGYKATLEAARTLRSQTLQAAQEILTYLKDTIKPTLQNLHGQLGNHEEGS